MTKQEELISEAKKWIGIREKGGDNKGPEIEMFQKASDGHASGQSWCMCFVQYCLMQVGGSLLAKGSHCLNVWNNSPKDLRLTRPEPGAIMIWRHKGGSSGHTGIVTRIIDDLKVETIEGNTGPMSIVSREGDGVYRKVRSIHPVIGNMLVVGWLRPFILS
jgi:uncharacterized protein (TIGR02594 family)